MMNRFQVLLPNSTWTLHQGYQYDPSGYPYVYTPDGQVVLYDAHGCAMLYADTQYDIDSSAVLYDADGYPMHHYETHYDIDAQHAMQYDTYYGTDAGGMQYDTYYDAHAVGMQYDNNAYGMHFEYHMQQKLAALQAAHGGYGGYTGFDGAEPMTPPPPPGPPPPVGAYTRPLLVLDVSTFPGIRWVYWVVVVTKTAQVELRSGRA